MMQIGLRTNGVLTECTDVTDRGPTMVDSKHRYGVKRLRAHEECHVVHGPADAALRLALLALTALLEDG